MSGNGLGVAKILLQRLYEVIDQSPPDREKFHRRDSV